MNNPGLIAFIISLIFVIWAALYAFGKMLIAEYFKTLQRAIDEIFEQDNWRF